MCKQIVCRMHQMESTVIEADYEKKKFTIPMAKESSEKLSYGEFNGQSHILVKLKMQTFKPIDIHKIH